MRKIFHIPDSPIAKPVGQPHTVTDSVLHPSEQPKREVFPQVAQQPQPKKCWTTEVKNVTACDGVPKTKGFIDLPYTLDCQIKAMSLKVNDLEWLAYLIGTVDGDALYTVTDLYVPEQLVTGGSVVVTEPHDEELMGKVIGTVHLHPFGGKAFLSGTDEEYIGGNHDVTIVTTKTGEYTAKYRKKLPCGHIMLVDAEVDVVMPDPGDLIGFINTNFPKIKREFPHPVAPVNTVYHPYSGWVPDNYFRQNPLAQTPTPEKTETTVVDKAVEVNKAVVVPPTKLESTQTEAERTRAINNSVDSYMERVAQMKVALDTKNTSGKVEWGVCGCCREVSPRHQLQQLPDDHTQYCVKCYIDMKDCYQMIDTQHLP